jgi:hypothetical protein
VKKVRHDFPARKHFHDPAEWLLPNQLSMSKPLTPELHRHRPDEGNSPFCRIFLAMAPTLLCINPSAQSKPLYVGNSLMNSFIRNVVAATVLSGLAASAAMATPVSYFGAIFDLSITDVGTPGGTYQVTYTADFTNFTNSAAQPFLDSLAWKHAGADVSTVSLVSYPGGGWVTSADKTVNASGCSTSGGNTWACTKDHSSPYVATSGLLSWVFNATFSSSSLSTLNTAGDSVKMRFVDSSGNKVGALLSCQLSSNYSEDNCDHVTKVAEPGSLALFGLGLLGLGLRASRRMLCR